MPRIWAFIRQWPEPWTVALAAAASGAGYWRTWHIVGYLAQRQLIERVRPARPQPGGGREPATWRLTDAGRAIEEPPIVRNWS